MGPTGHYRPPLHTIFTTITNCSTNLSESAILYIFCTFFSKCGKILDNFLFPCQSVCEFSLSMPVSQGGQYISLFPHYPTYINMSGEGQGVGRGRGRRAFIFLALCSFYILGGKNTLLNIICERSTFRKYKI